MSKDKPFQVLLVEDNPADAVLARKALDQVPANATVHVVVDGVEAIEYLRQRGKYAGATRPDVVLLDLNLPKLNGHEVLREVRADETLRTIPIVVLTSSCDELDVANSYDLGANSYLTKRPELSEFMEMMHAFGAFWLDSATLPSR